MYTIEKKPVCIFGNQCVQFHFKSCLDNSEGNKMDTPAFDLQEIIVGQSFLCFDIFLNSLIFFL